MPFDFIVAGIDPGLDIAGLSLIKHTVSPTNSRSECKLLSVSAIEADLGTTAARVRFLNSQFCESLFKVKEQNPGYRIIAAIECPNEVLYGKNPDRVSGVIKLIAAAYGIFGGIIGVCPTFIVRPTDWQPHKSKRDIKDVKAWSRRNANLKLLAFNSTVEPFEKTTQDLADSLNIGIFGLGQLIKKEWIV